ncbi:MAG: hypothetical protein EOP06_20580, partial [Proteobacteria bacterium]
MILSIFSTRYPRAQQLLQNHPKVILGALLAMGALLIIYYFVSHIRDLRRMGYQTKERWLIGGYAPTFRSYWLLSYDAAAKTRGQILADTKAISDVLQTEITQVRFYRNWLTFKVLPYLVCFKLRQFPDFVPLSVIGKLKPGQYAIGIEADGNAVTESIYSAPCLYITGATDSGKSSAACAAAISLIKSTERDWRIVQIDSKLGAG